MTESGFKQIRLMVTGIVTEAVPASEQRMRGVIAETGGIGRTHDSRACSFRKRLSEGLRRALLELDRRIADLEKRMIERQDAALQRAVERMAELVRPIETNLLTSFHGYAKGQTARLHS
jgi:molybdopterin-biosynthesis enzyme MoeA-like protein